MPARPSRYEVFGRIAQGGMAEIFAARAHVGEGLEKRVALKRILPAFAADEVFVRRFLEEARLAMCLSHAGIVQVFDYGRSDGGQPFLAMEFVEGVDLKRLLAAQPGPLALADALGLAAGLLRALDHAHRRVDAQGQPLQIVHRDVKPANVLVSFEGEVKLADFGLARSRQGVGLSVAGSLCGTIPYMSPEQARGLPVDPRSDVFSAGTLLYLLATGVHPFQEDEDLATLDRVRAATTAPASTRGAPAALDPILVRALAAEPDGRYASAGEFADAVEELAYATGQRAGLARVVSTRFPAERQRLEGLYRPTRHVFQMTAAADATGLTQLSRIGLRNTEPFMASAPPPPRRRLWAVPLTAVVAVGGVGAYLALRPRPTPVVAVGDAAPLVAAPPDGAPAPADAAPSAAAPPDAAPRRDAAAARALADAAPRARGTLTVNADPWAVVFVDGRRVGNTPVLAVPLAAGPHTVVVENPKLGRQERRIDVVADRDNLLTFELRAP